ncbi:cyclic nucleotide-binding domain protein (macronuclear) [Tetrahymena thermophila SB210]|uniref:Cyclic nucleotide-binding domain protein n=1 Tax=Tetrahymena thermophila (strain SB210) TaxID=312017 RepID=Q23WM1_TETTS|nr:cyclic nucleotide-binding domain protein [Tetrahymena thermophila SB210]EAS00959.2 cyclic nucleotide-binding domain protein [Tetrahymena thermophila SB210]|eukprot:XP_001021204.2 cyclic nucleotide-binding domain protein [Tetrahymena thermophila SB210]
MKENNNVNSIQDIVEVLQKKPDQRTIQDLKRLIYATQQIQFFDRYVEQGREKVLQKCCKHMKYEAMEKGQKVFEIDERGTKFYLILSGKVGVYIKDPNQQTNINDSPKIFGNHSHQAANQRDQHNEDIVMSRKQSKFAKDENAQNHNGQNTPNEKKFDPDDYFIQLRQKFSRPKKINNAFLSNNGNENIELYTPKNTHLMICVKEIEAGNAFGELALLNNKPRLATIVCHENCQFAILEKEDFTKILKDIEEKLLDQEISLLANLHIFQGWNKNLLKQLYLNSQKVKFNRGQVIFKEGDACDNVYIVNQGEFTTYKIFEFNRDQESKDLNLDEFKEQNIVDQLNQVHGSQKSIEALPIKMSILTPFEMFGEEDFLMKQDRTFSVKCTSFQGQLIVIKNKNFNIRIMQDDYTRQYLYERLEKKKKTFDQRSQTIVQQYRQYKQYLLASTDNLFDFCIEAIKKQSNEETDYHQINFGSKSISPAKSNNQQVDLKQKQNNFKLVQQKFEQQEQQQDSIHMLQKVLNYDLKYHRQSLQKGLSGMFNKEFKDTSIRKNQKEVNIEMQHYAKQFNQYETDKFINMNAQEEINNQELSSKLANEQNHVNDQQYSKEQRSKSVSTLKNETRDQLLNQYRQIIYEQSSIHFKIKCHQAQKPKSDRSKIDYLQIMREKEQVIQSPDKVIQKRRRAVSANSIKELQHNLSLNKSIQSQKKGINYFSMIPTVKTEASPEKGLYRYYSYNPPTSRKSISDSFQQEKKQSQSNNLEIQQPQEMCFDQQQEDIYDQDKQQQDKIKNQLDKQIQVQNSVLDKNKYQLIKVYQSQNKQKQNLVKQQQYITNYFIGERNQKILTRSQSQNQININQNIQEQKGIKNQQQTKVLNQKTRSSSVQTPFKDTIIINKCHLQSKIQNEKQIHDEISEDINALNQIDQLKENAFVQYQINNLNQDHISQNVHHFTNQISQQYQQKQPTQALFKLANNTNQSEREIKEDQNSNTLHYNLQDQLRKPKWRYEKYDILGNINLLDSQMSKIKNLQKNGIIQNSILQKQTENSQAFIASKIRQKK